jgi:hypothetical protein
MFGLPLGMAGMEHCPQLAELASRRPQRPASVSLLKQRESSSAALRFA